MARSLILLATLAISPGGCDGCEHPARARADALELDAVDGSPLDSTDATPDAMPDAATVTTAPACTSTPTQLYDASPQEIDTMALAGNVLYVSTYLGGSGQVVSIDLTTGTQADAPLTTSGPTYLTSANGDVLACDATAGTIWKLHPGTTPMSVVTSRPTPIVATHDGTYVYWAESNGSGNPLIVRRQLLAGGAVGTAMTSCANAHRLIVVGSTLYCLRFNDGAVQYAPSDGSAGPMLVSLDGYPANTMLLDGNDLYVPTLYNNPRLWGIPLPSGPATKLHELTTLGRYVGLAATPSYFYLIDTNAGISRMSRTTYTPQVIHSSVLDGDDPVAWNGQLYFAEQNPATAGLRYVMHCVD